MPFNATFKGVSLVSGEACRAAEGAKAHPPPADPIEDTSHDYGNELVDDYSEKLYEVMGCLVRVCRGSRVAFDQSSISYVERDSILTGLCVGPDSKVLIRTSSFEGNVFEAIAAAGNAVIEIVSSTFVDNYSAMRFLGFSKAYMSNTSIIDNRAGGLWVGSNAQLHISSCNVTGNYMEKFGRLRIFAPEDVGGGMLLMENATALVDGESIFANNSNEHGGAVALVDYASLTVTGSSRIISNAARLGAGFYISDNATVSISAGVLIADNIASENGGGMWVGERAIVTVSNASITANEASRGAGMWLADSSSTVMTNGSVVSRNIADDTGGGGGIVLDNHAKLNLTGGSRVVGNVADKGAGGGVQAYNASTVHIGEGVVFADNVAQQRGADLYAGPQVNLIFSESANINALNDTVDWQHKDCLVGEVRGGHGFCAKCVAPSFSLNPMNTSCDECPEHATCALDTVRPADGYWASSTKSVQIHKCPNADACPGAGQCKAGYTGMLCGKCEKGYAFKGPFSCGICMSNAKILAAIFMAGVFMLGLITYTVENTWSNTQRGALYHAKRSGDTSICVVCTGRQLVPEGVQQRHNAGGHGQKDGDATVTKGGAIAADLLKVLVMYAQYLVVIGSLQVEWPGLLPHIFTGAAWVFSVASSQVFSLDCLLQQYSSWSAPIPIQRFIVYLAMPLLMLSVGMVVQGVMACGRLAWSGKRGGASADATAAAAAEGTADDQEAAISECNKVEGAGAAPHWPIYLWVAAKLTVLCLVVFYFFYPSLARIGFVMFSCYTLDHPAAAEGVYAEFSVATAPRGYWVYDMEQPCWQGWHRQWALSLGLPCLIVFCIMVPPALGCWLWFSRKRLWGPRFQKRFGFLYHSYTPAACYWEGVVAAQTMVLVCISVFSPPLGVYFSVVLLSVVLAAIIVLQQLVRPFAFRVVHFAQLFATSCLFANVNVALSTFAVDRSASSTYKVAIGAIIFVVNLVFVAWCTVMMVSYGRHAVSTQLAKAVKWVKRVLACRCCRTKV
jgi:hypothetical protein